MTIVPIGSKDFTVDSVHMIIVKNDDGTEGIAGYMTPEGGIAPFFIEHEKKMPNFRKVAGQLAEIRGEARIVKFSGRQDIEIFKRRMAAND